MWYTVLLSKGADGRKEAHPLKSGAEAAIFSQLPFLDWLPFPKPWTQIVAFCKEPYCRNCQWVIEILQCIDKRCHSLASGRETHICIWRDMQAIDLIVAHAAFSRGGLFLVGHYFTVFICIMYFWGPQAHSWSVFWTATIRGKAPGHFQGGVSGKKKSRLYLSSLSWTSTLSWLDDFMAQSRYTSGWNDLKLMGSLSSLTVFR